MLRSNKPECNEVEDVEDANWEYTLGETETNLGLSKRLEEAMIEFGDEKSFLANVVEFKTSLLALNEAEGEVAIVAVESDWEATVGETVMGFLLSDKPEEVMTEIGGDESFMDIAVEGKKGLLRLNEVK